MSDNGSRKYIGVDLGAWYNKGNKTSIVIGVEENGKLKIEEIVKEYGEGGTDILVADKKEVLSANKWNKSLSYNEKNKYLVDFITREPNKDALIAIDAPFAIPSPLNKNIEDYFSANHNPAMENQYLFDNSARFVYKVTKQIVLAPAATLVGALTSRMAHIINNYSDILEICVTPHLNRKPDEEKIPAIEVFPTATLYQMTRALSAVDQEKYLQPYTNNEKDISEFTKIRSYKGDHWNGKKNKKGEIVVESRKGEMLELIKPFVKISNKWKSKIKTDDDYDAIICALTAYWVDKEDGYEKPKDQKDLDKFTNSFIYIPKKEMIRPE